MQLVGIINVISVFLLCFKDGLKFCFSSSPADLSLSSFFLYSPQLGKPQNPRGVRIEELAHSIVRCCSKYQYNCTRDPGSRVDEQNTSEVHKCALPQAPTLPSKRRALEMHQCKLFQNTRAFMKH